MLRILAVAALLLPLAGTGCSAWQANSGSQAVDIDPFAVGSGRAVFSPSNEPGYINGDPQDVRSKH
jgi:hypothetical protein